MALLLLLAVPGMAQDTLPQGSPPQRGAVALTVGEGRLMHLDHEARNVFMGDASIADVQVVTPQELYVYGRKPGQTTLSATDANSGVAAQLLLNVTRGTAPADATLPRGSAVAITFDADRLVVHGPVRNLGEALGASATAESFNRSKQPPVDLSQLPGAQQVTLRVRVAEVSRTAVDQLGVNFDVVANPGSFSFGLVTGSFLGQSLTGLFGNSTTTNFGQVNAGVVTRRVNGQVLLNALQSEGLLTTLAEPNLTTISGETARFLAGGEIPIPVPQALGVTTIEYKQFGVQLQFTPTLLPGNRIALKVHPTVSELSSANAVTISGVSVPSFIEREAETTVEMASGQTLSIAGLFQRNEQYSLSKFPGLGDIPVIGTLFRSTSYQRNETELVILVTPVLSEPVSNPNAFVLPTDSTAGTPARAADVAAGFVAN